MMIQKLFVIVLILMAGIHISCNENKSNKENPEMAAKGQKANLIDGTWEMDYMLPDSKPMDSLYPGAKPTIMINSEKSAISGNTGCNNFNGELNINGKSFDLSENLAVTRKMCRDMTGEKSFLQNLEKVDSYSVTNQGNTLNLIMGDIAIMRFQRK